MQSKKYRNHQEIISKLEKDLADLKILGENYVRLMGKDDPSLALRIDSLKKHYELLKSYQDKYIQLLTYSDVQLKIFNSNGRLELEKNEQLAEIKDKKIVDKIISRTWSESDYWGSVFVSVKDDYVAPKKDDNKKAKPVAVSNPGLSNEDAAEAYFAAAIYDPNFSSNDENLYIKRKKSISKSSLNLQEHYDRNGSLDDVPSNILDDDSKRILELVFRNGLDKTKEILMDERQNQVEVDVAVEDAPDKGKGSDIIEINLNDFEKLEVLSEYDLFALNLNKNIKVTIINIDYDNLEATGINYSNKNQSKQYKIVVTE